MTLFDNRPVRQPWWRGPLLSIIFLVTAVVFWILATVPLTWKQQAVFGGACLLLAVLISKVWRSNTATLILSLFSAFSTVRYAYYRVSETYSYLSVNWTEVRALDLLFVFALLGAELYAFVILFLGFFQTVRPLNRKPAPLPEDPDVWPSVDIYIPTYNEPLDVVRTTVLASLSVDWPSKAVNVYILDDGRRSEFREFAESCGCGYIIRPDNKHAKAGNINHALKKTNGEYIAIFDCDHIPTRSFLQVALGWFLRDKNLAMMQTPHHFYSPDPFERNLGIFRKIPNEGALFYGVIQDGSDYWNGTFFCGSCAVIRRTALEEIGGIAVETVTEDAHTSLRLQRRGWNTAYLRYPQAAGLATGTLAAHIGQRIRWARGMVQILRLDNPLFGGGLRMPQRLCYLNSMLHFLYAIPRLMFLTSPLVYLLLGLSNVYGYGRVILVYALPHLALSIVANSRVQGRFRYSFWNEVYETVLAPYILLPTSVALISPKHGKFNVTSKSDQIEEDYFDWKLAAPYVILLLLNVVGIVSGIFRMGIGQNRETLALNVIWCVVNSIVLGAATAVAREVKQRRNFVRIVAELPVTLEIPDLDVFATKTIDISRGGFAVPAWRGFSGSTGDRATAVFRLGEEEYKFPVVVIENGSRTSRFGFAALSLEQEEKLTRIIFGRADAWLDWRLDTGSDRPLLSFLNIIGIALQGFGAIATGTFELIRRPSKSKRVLPGSAVRNPALPGLGFALIGLLAASALAPCLRAQQAANAGPASAKATDSALWTQAQKSSAPSAEFNDAYDLAALGQKQGLMLKGSDARASVSFGVPVTKVVTNAKLELSYRASSALSPHGSSLTVSLNGSFVAAVPLAEAADPESRSTAVIDLPSDLLTAENSLTFDFKGHCAPGCLGGTPATLWMSIERATEVRLSGSVLAIANNLRLLPAPFFDGTSQRTVIVPMAFETSPDITTLQAAGVVASWLGTLADFRGIRFPVTNGAVPTGNVIVFAAKGSALLPESATSILGGPSIALRDNPSDPYGKILVITGENSEQILIAARALASGKYPRDGDSAEVGGFEMPHPRQPYDSPRWLSAGFQTVTSDDLRVYGEGAVNLYFRLPPDVSFGTQTLVPLRISYQLNRWTSKLRGEMRIRLNGEYVGSRRMAQSSDQGRQFAIVGLPVERLFPGNTLTLEFALASDTVLDPRQLPEENVLRDSSIDLTRLVHYVEMPRLDLFSNSGYPFTRTADLSDTFVVLNHDPTPQQTSVYLALLGLFGARTGYPALRLTLGYPDQAYNAGPKHLLVIGAVHDDSAGALAASSPATFEGRAIKIHPAFDALSLLPGRRWATQSRLAYDVLAGDPAPAAFMAQFASPYYRDKTVVLLDASDSAQWAAMERLLAENSRLAEIRGNVSMLQEGHFHSFALKSDIYSYGNLRWDDRGRQWLKNHYWLIPVFLLIFGLILASQLNMWLEVRAKNRLQMQS